MTSILIYKIFLPVLEIVFFKRKIVMKINTFDLIVCWACTAEKCSGKCFSRKKKIVRFRSSPGLPQ